MALLFIFHRVWKTVKYQGKIREKSRNFEVNYKWQPCLWSKISFLGDAVGEP